MISTPSGLRSSSGRCPMTQAAAQQPDEMKRVGRFVLFVHQRESRIASNRLIGAESKVLLLTSRAMEPAIFSSHAWGTKQAPLATRATGPRAVSTDGGHAHAGRAPRVRRCCLLTSFPATSTTSRRRTLPRLSSCDGGKVGMLRCVLFRRSRGCAR